MKKTLPLLLLLALFLFPSPLTFLAAATEVPFVSAECAALYDAQNRAPLYGKNQKKRHPMASTTKIMTALVAIEQLPLDTVITVPCEAVGIEGSSVYLQEGERYTLEALLYALLLQSANDAAVTIAYAIGGDVDGFSAMMNDRAAALGLSDTHFDNPHGLDSQTHYTTAADLAVMACELLEDPDLYQIVSTRRYIFTDLDGSSARTLINHNKMLMLYDGAVGVKTGYTKKCGRCLVSAAKRDDLLLVAVTLDAPSDWADHTKLLDMGFATYESRLIAAPHTLSLTVPLLNTDRVATVSNQEEIRLVMRRGDPAPSQMLDILPLPVAPLKKGAVAGTVIYRTADGRTASSPLVFTEDIFAPKDKKGWFGLRR